MARNKNLIAASKAKEDEFYTRMADITDELFYYRKFFEGKVIFCNCDDPYESNFFKFFALKFNAWRLKKLICTCYDGSSIAGNELPFDELKEPNHRKAYKYELTEVSDLNGDGATDLLDVRLFLEKHPPELLKGNGSFDSEECVALLDEADIVVTNPPFSRFRDYINLLVEHKKQFLIIGNKNNITYKDVFPLIKGNKVWLGYNAGRMKFVIPRIYDSTKKNIKIMPDGTIISSMGNTCWFTNIPHNRRKEDIDLYRKYDPILYPKFDNYDAIFVKSCGDIPMDYDGCMAVPPDFILHYNPEQFEILGITDRDNNSGQKTKVYTKSDAPNYSDLNRRGVLKVGSSYKLCWPTIIIRKKK